MGSPLEFKSERNSICHPLGIPITLDKRAFSSLTRRLEATRRHKSDLLFTIDERNLVPSQ